MQFQPPPDRIPPPSLGSKFFRNPSGTWRDSDLWWWSPDQLGSHCHRIRMLSHPHPRPQICSGQLVVRSHSDLARVVGVDPCRIPFDPRWTSDHHRIHRSEDRMNCAKSRIKKFFWSLLGSASSRDLVHRSDLHPVSDLAGQIRDTSQNTRVPDFGFRFEPR